MVRTIDTLTEEGCGAGSKEKLCRSRGGESCAFDGAMIVLQPIADTAHLVHGPIACCGNSWEGRGTRSGKGDLHAMGFTTDMSDIDIVYGSEEKLLRAIRRISETVSPRAIFVYSTCVSGLTGEDIEPVCRRGELETGTRVIPVNAPGFVGPKNLGNRIAGQVLLDHVIGTGEPQVKTHTDVNLIGEYNIAGDLGLIEPVLAEAGIRVLSRITGDSTFEEITWAHRARLNVVVCGRALINVAREMERTYGIPYVEASFYGSTEMRKALHAIKAGLSRPGCSNSLTRVDALLRKEEGKLKESLRPYRSLRGKKAVLYTGGVKSWSFISALRDLGIEVVAVGTKKSTADDEEKMKDILGTDAPLVEDVTPKNILKLLNDRGADMLIAGGRNQYLAAKEGYPFVDVNQERHRAYAGYRGLLNLAEDISKSLRFYTRGREAGYHSNAPLKGEKARMRGETKPSVLINPLKHSPAIGAALALQGIDRAVPVIHGAQGCTFLAKVLLTKHFREPIALESTKLFVEDVVMGSGERLISTIKSVEEKGKPELIGILTSGMAEVKGDDIAGTLRQLDPGNNKRRRILYIPTPDYEGSLETGYAKAVEHVLESLIDGPQRGHDKKINILAGPHLTPADCSEIREIAADFGIKAIVLPDLSGLDGSRQGFSALAEGGLPVEELTLMSGAVHTLALGKTMEPAAGLLKRKTGITCSTIESCAGLHGTDAFLNELKRISGRMVPEKYERQRRVLIDCMRDSHAYLAGKKICMAVESDLAVQTSNWLAETGAAIDLVVIPALTESAGRIMAREVIIGDFFSIKGEFHLLIGNSHAESTAKRLGVPHYEIGFPVYKSFGYTSKVSVGYRGTLNQVRDVANLLMKAH